MERGMTDSSFTVERSGKGIVVRGNGPWAERVALVRQHLGGEQLRRTQGGFMRNRHTQVQGQGRQRELLLMQWEIDAQREAYDAELKRQLAGQGARLRQLADYEQFRQQQRRLLGLR